MIGDTGFREAPFLCVAHSGPAFQPVRFNPFLPSGGCRRIAFRGASGPEFGCSHFFFHGGGKTVCLFCAADIFARASAERRPGYLSLGWGSALSGEPRVSLASRR